MTEGPNSPEDNNQKDREVHAILGHLIEMWDILENKELGVDERIARVTLELKQRLAVLYEKKKEATKRNQKQAYQNEIKALSEDLHDIESVLHTEEALKDLAEDRRDSYIDLKDEYDSLDDR